tara:strand:+ start:1609 stop:2106 length:498 start_codon:yes stop_codon:yes gene_type:complete
MESTNNEEIINNKNNDKDKELSFIFDFFWEKIESSSFSKIISNILDRNLDNYIKEKFILYLHKKSIKDKSIIRAIDSKNIIDMYKYLSDESIVKIITKLDLVTNVNVIECIICSNYIDKPYSGQCGHIFCQECLDKHIRSSKLRNQVPKCPTCRREIDNCIRIFI